MTTMEQHPLQKRLPDDVDWEEFESLELRRQCIVRNIPSDKTSREHKIRLLQEYHNTHVTEVRKVPWCRRQDPISERYSRMGTSSYQITRVKDKSASNETGFRKDFTLRNEKGSIYVIAFKEIPTCTCRSQFKYHCQHIMYIFRHVLNCPDPIRWQAAFLPTELEIIYRHSHAVDSIPLTNGKAQTNTCFLCFQYLSVWDKKNSCGTCGTCGTCGRVAHLYCAEAARKVRKLKQASGCWVCEDTAEWDIEKYREQNHIPAATMAGPVVTAATTTATIAPAAPTPTTNLVQKFIERKDKDNHGLGSSSPSRKQDDRDTQVNNNPKVNQRPSHPPQSSASFSSSSSNFPTPSQSAVNQQELLPPPSLQQPSQASKDVAPQLKGSISLPVLPLQKSTSAPLMSNQEPMRMDLKQQKEQEREANPLLGDSQDCSPALTTSLSSVPSVQYPFPSASAARARTLEQAGQTPVLSADGVDSHNSAATTAAVTAQAATPVPPDGIPGVVGCPSPISNMDADVHRKKAARLVRKCRRLEKESARIGKRVKRGMDDIDREYKLELKMLKEKRKNKYMRIEKKWERELKGLKHKAVSGQAVWL